MSKYYTRACNFYYGKSSLEMLKKKKALPLHGNQELSFETVEILSRKKKRKLNINIINSLSFDLKKKIKEDLKKITKKKSFCKISLKEPLLIGILNLTPDSFSDGGDNLYLKDSFNNAEKMTEDGADFIDIGGESTRPGSKMVLPADEAIRVLN